MKTDYVVTIDEHSVTVKFANEIHTIDDTRLNVSLLSVTLRHENNDIGEIIAAALFDLEQQVDDLVCQSLMEYQSDDY